MAGLGHFTDVFERAKEEIHSVKEKAKEEIQTVLLSDKLHLHHNETHGTSDDIDENIPTENVKATNAFERAKEEVEALIETIHIKNGSEDHEERDQTVKTEAGSSGAKAIPDLVEKAKEGIEAIIHHHKETHGKRDDIDENTPVDEIKAPNLLERAKEEVEAIAGLIHAKKDSDDSDSSTVKKEGSGAKVASDLIEKAKEGIEAIIHHDKLPHHHHKETHGRNEDINESTPIDEVKAPNIFERAKEEVEAVIGSLHPKKESNSSPSSPEKKEESSGFGASIGRGLEKVCSSDGLGGSIGKGLEKICSPWGSKKN